MGTTDVDGKIKSGPFHAAGKQSRLHVALASTMESDSLKWVKWRTIT
jgi:hypothetical protein